MGPVQGHAKEKYTTGRRLASSEERGWAGLRAECWRHGPGELGAIKPHDTEVAVLIKGAARVRRRGDGKVQQHDAAPGSLWLCPAGIAEDYVHIEGRVDESLHLFLPASPLSSDSLRAIGTDPSRVRLRYEGGFRDQLVEQMALAIRHELSVCDAGDRLLVETLAEALSVQLFRRYSNVPPDRLSTPSVGALDKPRLRRVLEFVEDRLEETLHLATLAELACLSPYHFARAFKSAVGVPPHRYVVERRVERAKRLLERDHAPLVEIALVCGFSSQSHLARSFRRVTGITPTVFRRSRQL